MTPWTTEDPKNVTIVLPNGSEEVSDSVTAAEVNEIALDAGLASFEVKDASGNQLEADDFPVTEGKITISEYNEAKLWLTTVR